MNISLFRKRVLEAGVALPAIALLSVGFAAPASAQDSAAVTLADESTDTAVTAGNAIVVKPATDTAWIVRLLIDCFRDANFPDGVVNFVTGPGSTLGQALVDSPEVDGVTFTGSFDVGMKMFQSFAKGK